MPENLEPGMLKVSHQAQLRWCAAGAKGLRGFAAAARRPEVIRQSLRWNVRRKLLRGDFFDFEWLKAEAFNSE